MSRDIVTPARVVDYLVSASTEELESILAAVTERRDAARESLPPSGPRAAVELEAATEDRQSGITTRPQGPAMNALVPQVLPQGPSAMTNAEAGNACLRALLGAMPCLAGLIHLYDAQTGDFVVAGAEGIGAGALLGSRHSLSDPILSAATAKRAPVIVDYEHDEISPPARHSKTGDPWSAMVCPVVTGGLVLGAIELIDRTDGSPFDDRCMRIIGQIADQYAQFLWGKRWPMGSSLWRRTIAPRE